MTDNTIRKDNLVVLKDGIGTFNTETTEFKPHTFYRSISLNENDNSQIMVFGVVFNSDKFNELFEFAQNKILRDFEQLGVIVNGKLISKTAFAKRLDIHQYGKRTDGFKIAYLYKNPRELLYGFFPFFRGDTKKECINSAYISVQDIIDGDMNCVDENYVQFGNCGIPITANPNTKLKVRDTTNDKPFIL